MMADPIELYMFKELTNFKLSYKHRASTLSRIEFLDKLVTACCNLTKDDWYPQQYKSNKTYKLSIPHYYINAVSDIGAGLGIKINSYRNGSYVFNITSDQLELFIEKVYSELYLLWF